MPPVRPFELTTEQAAARSAFVDGRHIALDAGAGTGKTATLMVLGYSLTGTPKKALYLAYNKAMQVDAEKKFPRNVECRTTHSVAYRWRAQGWGRPALDGRLKGKRPPLRETQRHLRVTSPARVNDAVVLAPQQIVSIAMEAVERFTYSADRELLPRHVPRKPPIDSYEDHKTLIAIVLPVAKRIWDDLESPRGSCRYTPDVYLKAYSLSDPTLGYDVVFLDEAQDTNPAVAHVFTSQCHAQLVAVGDANQSIYQWRGAENFLADYSARSEVKHLFLTQSWRFGPEVAALANDCLGLLDSDLRITGAPNLDTKVGMFDGVPDAVLCRGNAQAVVEVIQFHADGVKVHLASSAGKNIRGYAQAALDLKEKGITWHPELCLFTSWGQVQEYVEQCPEGKDLGTVVKLIDTHGPDVIIDAIDKCADEKGAQVTVTTAHSSKGREWDRVRIADDWRDPKDDDGKPLQLDSSEYRLAYVALTRGRKNMNPGQLGGIIASRLRLEQQDPGSERPRGGNQ
jgi:hypothetical protein